MMLAGMVRGLAAAGSRSFVQIIAQRSIVLLMPKSTSPWNMRKDELVTALHNRDVLIHESWTVRELRGILVEQIKVEKVTEPTETRGLAKMSLQQLIDECKSLDIEMPGKPTRGHLMLLLRDQKKSPGHTVMSFGRYKG